MSLAVITGSASGIGKATRDRLEREGNTVIGIDLRDAEVIADLATAAGRETMVAEVTRASGGALDAVVACAGVSGRTSGSEVVVRLNYFGAVATLAGLRPLLAKRRGAAVAISSNAATTSTELDDVAVGMCLRGDEDAVAAYPFPTATAAYGVAKLALARWVRIQSVTDDWIGAGIRLNAIAPGLIVTPMTQDGLASILETPGYPRPTDEPGRPEEVAGLIRYLLSDEARYFVGSLIVMDGGTDAALHGQG